MEFASKKNYDRVYLSVRYFVKRNRNTLRIEYEGWCNVPYIEL